MVSVTCTIIMGMAPVPLKGMKPESTGAGIAGMPAAGAMGCIFVQGAGKVDCVTVWFLAMKLNCTMSHLAAATLSGE